MPCDPNLLAGIKMFELLNEDDRIALAAVVDEMKLPQGHTLFQAGDPGDSLFIVQGRSSFLSKTQPVRKLF
jgi:CRP-like cAMP-binding protein